MSNNTKVEIPETVILEMQSKAHEFLENIKEHDRLVEVAARAYDAEVKERMYAVLKLRETLDFLQEHNPEANNEGDWYGEMGFTREELLELEKPKGL